VDATVIGFVPRTPGGCIDVQRLVVPLKNRQGDVAAWALAVPFLRPGDVPRMDGSSDPYKDGVALLYAQALAHAQQLRQPGQALIALGHCHMVGGQTSSDSERSIVIGGSEALPSGLFDARVAYAALGHLHLAQRVGGQHHLRYCGSPLPLSFAELAYPHQVLRVDLQGDVVSAITPLSVPRAVDLLRVPAQPAPLPAVLAALKALALPPQADPQRQPYLEVRVRLDAPEPGLRSQIEAALVPHAVRLAKIETSFAAAADMSGAAAHTSLDALEQLQPSAVFDQLYRSKYHTDTPAALSAALAELLLADDTGLL
jgi:exonuclease SbcD